LRGRGRKTRNEWKRLRAEGIRLLWWTPNVSKIHPLFQALLLIVLLWNLIIYEINLQNLTLFLAKTPFGFLMRVSMEINLGKNKVEVFMEKKKFEKKTVTRGHLACK
jgi:hypothetical protein